jgi:hypothetical protein
VGLSVFTTQSATAVLEHIRDKIKTATPEPANFLLGPGGSRTVFSLSSIQTIDWQQQIKVNPPAFQTFKPQFPGATNLAGVEKQGVGRWAVAETGLLPVSKGPSVVGYSGARAYSSNGYNPPLADPTPY